MKLPSQERGVIVFKSDQKATRKCYENSLKTKRGVCMVTTQPTEVRDTPRVETTTNKRPESADEVQERDIGGNKFKLGRSTNQELHNKIAEVIARHLDAFA